MNKNQHLHSVKIRATMKRANKIPLLWHKWFFQAKAAVAEKKRIFQLIRKKLKKTKSIFRPQIMLMCTKTLNTASNYHSTKWVEISLKEKKKTTEQLLMQWRLHRVNQKKLSITRSMMSLRKFKILALATWKSNHKMHMRCKLTSRVKTRSLSSEIWIIILPTKGLGC